MDLKLKEKTVLVTGASGGIGSEIARQFAAEGANVVVHFCDNESGARAVVESMGQQRGLAVGGDLTRAADTARVFAEARDRFGRLHAMVSCVGLWPAIFTPVHEMSVEQWHRTLNSNLTSAFLSCREFLAGVAADPFEDPSIVLIGSTAAVFGEAGHGDYAAAKAGLAFGLMLSLKNEIARLARRGRVNAICPGWTVTPMARKFTDDGQSIRAALSTIALRKVASPSDIAPAVLFLSSSAVAGHITGQVLTISGGMEGRRLYGDSELDLDEAIPNNG